MTRRPLCNAETSSALVLLPSLGLGGGVEALAGTIVDAMRTLGVEVEELALLSAENPHLSTWAKIGFSFRALRRSRRQSGDLARIVVMHPSLAVIALLTDLMRRGRQPRPAIFFYDIADIRLTPRWLLAVVRRRGLPIVTISSFSAGALAATGAGRASVLAPTLSTTSYAAFAGVQRTRAGEDLRDPEILTVCRLEQWEGKGIPVLVEAVETLRSSHPAATLVVAGRGPAPAELVALADSRPWVRIVESPSLTELVQLYRAASIFVLATRTRSSRGMYPTGEGFGLVLAEAQLAGLPVVAPASGGSADAIVEGVTGLRPTDESPAALAAALLALVDDPVAYTTMSQNAATWAAQAFCPERTVAGVQAALLGGVTPTLRGLHLTGEPNLQAHLVCLDGLAGAAAPSACADAR